MKKILIHLAIIGTVISQTFLLVPETYAHSSGCYNNWTPGKNCPLAPYTGQYTFVEQYGYYWTDSKYMRWNKSDSDHIKNSGHKYTHDNTDGDKHYSATSNYGTNLPSPAFDRDYDWWNGVYNEAEITANSSSFPTPEANYWTQFQWKRNRIGDGHMYFTSQLSSHEWGEWNSKHYDLLFDQYYDRGHFSSMEVLFDSEWVQSSPPVEPEVLFSKITPSYRYDVIKTGPHSDINVNVDLQLTTRADLERYLRENEEKARALLHAEDVKNIPVVITFNHPISTEELQKVQREYSVDIQSFEARVKGENNEKVTIGGVPDETGNISVERIFQEVLNPQRFPDQQFELVGVTSIEASLAKNDLTPLQKNPLTFVIDVLPAWIQINDTKDSPVFQEHHDRLDININDLYWAQEELL